MPTLYLVDAHDVVLSTSKINDTVNVPSGYVDTALIRGSFPVSLPYDVPMDGLPTDLNSLITKKYAGILSLYPGYSNILFDEQTDASGWQSISTNPGSTVGSRQTTSIRASTNGLRSVTTVLSSIPQLAVVRWEAFQYFSLEGTDGVIARTYKELDPAVFQVLVSFDSGANFQAVTNGMIFDIPLGFQGSNFQIRFNRTSITTPARAWLGSWALVY